MYLCKWDSQTRCVYMFVDNGIYANEWSTRGELFIVQNWLREIRVLYIWCAGPAVWAVILS